MPQPDTPGAAPEPPPGSVPEPRAPVRLRVVQCNILHGGWPYEVCGRQLFVRRDGRLKACEKTFTKLSYPHEKAITGDPGSEFARLMQDVLPDVIGMQEVGEGDDGRLRDLLGADWRNTPPMRGAGASCIFWNSATVAATGDAEVRVVQRYLPPDKPDKPGKAKAVRIRVAKQRFVHAESQKTFAVVTGKSWHQGTKRDRLLRAQRTRDFALKDGLTTMIAIDMTGPGSPAFAAMAPFVAKGSEKTCPAGICQGRMKPTRTDHVFYNSPHLHGPQTDGILQCVTGPFFGSDHLFVWADVTLP